MKIIVGLGNPGLKYKKTRHNAGYLAIEALAAKRGINIKKKGFQGIYGVGSIDQNEVMLFEPQTYMNLSGEAVEAVCSSKLEEVKDLLVVSDDFHIPIGSIRLREKGSAGGHNGLRSIIERMGSDFARLRIGIGTGEIWEDMSGFVLTRFSSDEKKIIEENLEKTVECMEVWLEKGARLAMGQINN